MTNIQMSVTLSLTCQHPLMSCSMQMHRERDFPLVNAHINTRLLLCNYHQLPKACCSVKVSVFSLSQLDGGAMEPPSSTEQQHFVLVLFVILSSLYVSDQLC